MPYLALGQVVTSAARLSTLHAFFGFGFLAAKKAALPIGNMAVFTSRTVTELVLDEYYRLELEERYFSPFATSNPSDRWLSKRYASTSLQRIMADTFGDAFIHPKGSSLWGWKTNYVQTLQDIAERLRSSRIPLIDLCVWLYRKRKLPAVEPETLLVRWFLREFNISSEELSALFLPEDHRIRTLDLSDAPVDDDALMDFAGWPSGSAQSSGVVLSSLSLHNVGPAKRLEYLPTLGLNVLVGDNSVGKTFLLDTAWWALTGTWSDYAAEPKDRNVRLLSEIRVSLQTRIGTEERFGSLFDSVDQSWQDTERLSEGFGVYARHDGTFAVWDTLRPRSPRWRTLPSVLVFDRAAVWDGLSIVDRSNRRRNVSNGLVRDLVSWRRDKGDAEKAALFASVLRTLAQGTEIVGLGPDVSVPDESRPVPTLKMSYGTVPIVYASAGAKRALAIAYLVVWAWTEHCRAARGLGRLPYTNVVMMLDEIEAHLHPKWQRRILPAIAKLWRDLAEEAEPQVHVATHSAMVLASLEPEVDVERDSIHVIQIRKNDVSIERRPIIRHGTVDGWLTSDIFAMDSARSLPAETAIKQAKRLQSATKVTKDQVEAVHRDLLATLPDDDAFWIRWNYFRERVIAKRS